MRNITSTSSAAASSPSPRPIAGHQFFAAATVEDLKALLDRVDGRTKTPALDSDANFRAAMKQMPADYAWMFYLQPKPLAQKLATLRAQSGRSLPPDQQTMIERIQSFSHAMVFEGGKIRDIGFAAMPRVVENQTRAHNSRAGTRRHTALQRVHRKYAAAV